VLVRVDVRAPVRGVMVKLSYHTPGAWSPGVAIHFNNAFREP